MEIIKFLIDFILHLDVHLGQIISQYGVLTYAILFGIIFVETGLVLIPFLPGDSLLFAAGAFAAIGSLNIAVLLILLSIAAIAGDTVNYWIGHFFGEAMIANPKIPIERKHIDETKKFFDKYGGKTIVLARFIPIVRTFAPFVAGVGRMEYKQFVSFNIIGGLLWAVGVTFCGYFFGNIPFVKHNFSIIVIAIVFISILPIVFPLVQHQLKKLKKPSSKKIIT